MIVKLRATIPRLREKAELAWYRPPVDVICEVISKDADGKVIERRQFRSHSFVGNFIQLLWMWHKNQTGGVNVSSGVDISGTTRTFVPVNSVTGLSGNGAAPTVIAGTGANIVVGTGTTTPAFGDSALGGLAARISPTMISQPLYAATSKFAIVGTALFATATTINEVGVELNMDFNTTTGATFLMIHDTISGGFAVAANGSITVVYTISVTT